MKVKYYLELEIRYTGTRTIYDDHGMEQDITAHFTNVLHSDLYEHEQACVDLGNKLITDNEWIKQHPGDAYAKLERRYGFPLELFSLKNGAQIFLKVLSMTCVGPEYLDTELKKFNRRVLPKKKM